MKDNIKYNIDIASKKTGLTKNTIRAWEQRYSFLNPERTETKRRLYSDEEIEKLSLLAMATQSGFKIGNIFSLSKDELMKLLNQSINSSIGVSNSTGFDFSKAMECIKNFDHSGFRGLLDDAMIEFSKPAFLQNILIPLVEQIGIRWKEGSFRISQEHFASSIITGVLSRMRETEVPNDNSPAIIVCTPAGQRHEIGALIASVLIASSGWKVVYLGIDLPAEDIAFAAKKTNAKAIAMSIVFPVNDSQIKTELLTLNEYLPTIKIIIGSRYVSKSLVDFTNNITILDEFSSIFEILEKIKN
ncbi:MAG: MerR family transcriptional regulator [Candidatus Kapabacteria bacterium]|nr:MerR family transcriptional regulator [Ignavibacteriota bacterium]MCW5883565.1 MerR family transcriptional regulator [Candidatus Kapabacteria bacterium]